MPEARALVLANVVRVLDIYAGAIDGATRQ
jgi:D-tagatose-1,6-bisphosphate aldolase subunit GatZ/KbaZ